MRRCLLIILPVFLLAACEEKAKTVAEWMKNPKEAAAFAAECRNKYSANLSGIPQNCSTAYEADFQIRANEMKNKKFGLD